MGRIDRCYLKLTYLFPMAHPGAARLTQASEKYLEAILRLENQKGAVRVTDLAATLGLKKGTVSAKLKSLKQRNVIDYSPYQSIQLTKEGRHVAQEIVWRNWILVRFLREVLGLDQETSEAAARRMGATVDEHVVDRMLRWLD